MKRTPRHSLRWKMRIPLMCFNNRQVACAKSLQRGRCPVSLHPPNFPHLPVMTRTCWSHNILETLADSGNIWFNTFCFALHTSGGSFVVKRANINNYFPKVVLFSCILLYFVWHCSVIFFLFTAIFNFVFLVFPFCHVNSWTSSLLECKWHFMPGHSWFLIGYKLLTLSTKPH